MADMLESILKFCLTEIGRSSQNYDVFSTKPLQETFERAQNND